MAGTRDVPVLILPTSQKHTHVAPNRYTSAAPWAIHVITVACQETAVARTGAELAPKHIPAAPELPMLAEALSRADAPEARTGRRSSWAAVSA